MSIQRDVWVTCDDCHNSEFAEGNATDAEARKIVREQGWKRVRRITDMLDLCPACYEKFQEERKTLLNDALNALAKSTK